METFKTLDEIYSATRPHQVTAQELLNGRTHLTDGGWQEIKLSPELRQEICQKLSEQFGGRTNTKERVFRSLMRENRQHWGLSRTVIEKYGERPAYLCYIAGQDQTWENKEIRKVLAA